MRLNELNRFTFIYRTIIYSPQYVGDYYRIIYDRNIDRNMRARCSDPSIYR